jgi:hypothetical protein
MRIYKTIILPVVLYGCETRSLSLREEHRPKVFENKVLNKIFGQNRDEMTGGWRKLHNEELRNLYPSPSIIRIIKSRSMRWAEHVARKGEKRSAYRLFVVWEPSMGTSLRLPKSASKQQIDKQNYRGNQQS